MRSVKVILVAIMFGLIAAPAMAMPIMLDIGTAIPGYSYGGDGDDYTGVFDQFTFKAQTTTDQYMDGTFTDRGDLYMTDYAAGGLIDTEGLNQFGGHEFTATWDNITGYVSGGGASGTILGGDLLINSELTYTGGTMKMYVDTAMDRNWGAGYGADDNTGFDGGTSFHVATLELITGLGSFKYDQTGSSIENQGSTDFVAQFTYVLDNFWYNQYGEDLYEKYVALNWLLAVADQNTDHIEVYDGDASKNILYTVLSDHDGSLELEPIPEPTTLLLLGMGLFGLGIAGYRRKKS